MNEQTDTTYNSSSMICINYQCCWRWCGPEDHTRGGWTRQELLQKHCLESYIIYYDTYWLQSTISKRVLLIVHVEIWACQQELFYTYLLLYRGLQNYEYTHIPGVQYLEIAPKPCCSGKRDSLSCISLLLLYSPRAYNTTYYMIYT